MPIIPLLIGGLALTGGLAIWNRVDDAIIDPLSGVTDRPILSDRAIALFIGAAALFLIARRQGLA